MSTECLCKKNWTSGAGEMAQQLRALAALPEVMSLIPSNQSHGGSQPYLGGSDALFRQADIYAAHHSYIKKRKQTGHLHHPQQWGHQGSQGGKTGKARVDEGGQEQNVVSTSEHTYIHPEHLHIHVKTYSPGSRLHL
jgi:hypothetical protein